MKEQSMPKRSNLPPAARPSIAFRRFVIEAGYRGRVSKSFIFNDQPGYLAGYHLKSRQPTFVVPGTFTRDVYQAVLREAKAAGLEPDRIMVIGDFATYLGDRISFNQLDDLAAVAAYAKSGRVEPTDSEEFRLWFDGSQVVDGSGRPLPVFHGASQDFAAFEPSRKGIFFTSSAASAAAYAGQDAGAVIMPVYLALRSPYRGHVARRGPEVHELVTAARKEGHDGAILTHHDFPGEGIFVAFEPTQVKSATGNVGAYSPTDPDIRHSMAEPSDEGLRQAHRTLRQEIAARVEYGRLLSRQHEWQCEVGDIFLSTKRQTTYEVIDRGFTGVGEKVSSGRRVATYIMRDGEGNKNFFREDRLLQDASILPLTRPYLRDRANLQAVQLVADTAVEQARQQSIEVEASPAFRAWFGDSRVVNAEGKPLMVFHGTTRDFSKFSAVKRGEKTGGSDARLGFFFAENPKAAEQFTWEAGERDGANIMPVYLSMQNPLVVTDVILDGSTGTRAGAIMQQAMVDGHDGVIFENSDMLGHKGRSFAVFEATQVKSALGNSGRFNSRDADIRHSLADGAVATDSSADLDAAMSLAVTPEERQANFDRWFKGSQVVDYSGAPLTLYHGTSEKFTAFSRGRIGDPFEGGFFFTPMRSIAEDYGDVVMEVHLSIRRPMVLTEQQWASGAGGTPEELKAKGYDGIRVCDYDMSGGEDTIFPQVADMWIAFEPTQIKSVVANIGTYDRAEPDIRHGQDEWASAPEVSDASSQVRQTETAAFKAWFGDSKAVDAEGAPLVVYHGTSDEFSEFSPSTYKGESGGIFFTADKPTAEAFATSSSETTGADERIVAAYLSVQDPKIIDAEEIMSDGMHSFEREFDAVTRARNEGYDGLLIRNVPEHDGRVADQWVAFRPEQVKSATSNRGTFDPRNSDIRSSLADQAGEPRDLFQETGSITRLKDGIVDRGHILFDGYYSNGYPWQTGWVQESGISVAMDSSEILKLPYTAEGMKLRDAIRHAEIVGDPVPEEAYARLGTLTRPAEAHGGPQAPDNAEFRAWFRASQLVDQAGHPRALFYGTGSGIDQLRPSRSAFFGEGIYLTSDAAAAGDYAADHHETPVVMPVFARLERPYVFYAPPAVEEPSNVTLARELMSASEVNDLIAVLNAGGEPTDQIKGKLQAMGHDGLVVHLVDEPTEYIVFDGDQVKSAFSMPAEFQRQEAPGSSAWFEGDVVDDDGDMPGAKYAESADGAYVRFGMDRAGNLRLQSMASSPSVRGRDMLAWLNETYGRAVVVDEVDPQATDFWDKMQTEGLIASWSHRMFAGKTVPVTARERDADIRSSLADDWAAGEPDTAVAEVGETAFDRWFGQSHVRDDKGEPRVLFHGTGADFASFRISKRGTFGAGIYFGDADSSWNFASGHDTPAIMPVYLSLQNPYYTDGDFNAGDENDLDSPAVPLIRALYGEKANAQLGRARNRDGQFGQGVRERLMAKGHDGIIVTYNDGSQEYVAFHPWQVKSALGNDGTYAVDVPDIRHSAVALDWTEGQRHELVMGGTRLTYLVSQGGRHVQVQDLVTAPGSRGAGNARRLMELLLQHADRQRAAVRLLAVAQDAETDDARLVRFYSSLGFEPLEQNEGAPTMVRPTFEQMVVAARSPNWKPCTSPEKMRAEIIGMVGLTADELRESVGSIVITTSNKLDPSWNPIFGNNLLANFVRNDDLRQILGERRSALGKMIGQLQEGGAVLRHLQRPEWAIVQPISDGTWRVFGIRQDGFFAMARYGTRQQAMTALGRRSYSVPEDVERISRMPALQRGLFIGEMQALVARKEIDLSEANSRVNEFDRLGRLMHSVTNRISKAFFDPVSNTTAFLTDRIAQGGEAAIFLHEMFHKHGRKALGDEGMKPLADQVRAWESAPEDSLERKIHDRALARARAAMVSGPHFYDEVFAYAVEEAVSRGVQPSAIGLEGSAERWLHNVVASIRRVAHAMVGADLEQLTPQDIVDFAYALAQMENPQRAAAIQKELGEELDGLFARIVRPGKGGPTWFSALRAAVSVVPMERAPAEEWINQVRATVQKGASPAEIEWSGLLDWLKLQSGPVHKSQLLSYLDANGVQVEEIVLKADGGQITSRRDSLLVDLTALGFDPDQDTWSDEMGGVVRRADGALFSWDADEEAFVTEDGEELPENVALVARELGETFDELAHLGDQMKTRYDDYTLSGGTDYTELLLKLPDLPRFTHQTVARVTWCTPEGEPRGRTFRTAEEAQAYIDDERETCRDAGEFPPRYELQMESGLMDTEWSARERREKEYASPHWKQANVLAHVRLIERAGPAGQRVLFVEEVQSDWAQQGRQRGFVGPDTTIDGKTASQWMWRAEELFGKWSGEEDDVKKEWQKATSNARELRDRYRSMGLKSDAVEIPSGPFVTSTEAWVSLAIKRIVKMAVDEGFDSVAFVNGRQSVDRYDLSKTVSRVSWSSDGALQIMGLDGDQIGPARQVSADKIADYIGKAAAERLLKSEPRADGCRIIEGDGLKVGGEGMAAFYDSVLPRIANQVIRRLGGERLQPMDVAVIPESAGAGVRQRVHMTEHGWAIQAMDRQGKEWRDLGEPFATRQEARQQLAAMAQPSTQLGFQITPAMRRRAERGMPLFSLQEPDQKLAAQQHILDHMRGQARAKTPPVWPMYSPGATSAAPGLFP